MSSIASGGGSFTNLHSSLSQPTRPNNPQPNTPATNAISPAPNRVTLPRYDKNDPRATLKTLIRCIMRTFYEVPKSLVIEYIYHHDRIRQEDLAARLCLDPNKVRSYIQEFKRDKFIIEDHKLESNDGTKGRRNQDQYYYKIDTTAFINVVKYRLINMQTHVGNSERERTYMQSNYKCEGCGDTYVELDIVKLYDSVQDAFICRRCGGILHEDAETKETTITNRPVANMTLFNEDMQPLFEILEDIDKIMTHDQQLKNAADQDPFQLNGTSSTNHHVNKDSIAPMPHRSHASNVFDRTATINHDVQIIIEKDEDDHYSPMDIDETSNTDSTISSSRGPGKPNKKSVKSAQTAAEVASQPVSTKMKFTSKKVPYEPKPIPHWFARSTVFVDHDEDHRLHNASLHLATHGPSMNRQLSNQKLVKSATVDDIKQMLLIHESRRKKTSTLTTMEDSSSPPTPLQITKTTDSQ